MHTACCGALVAGLFAFSAGARAQELNYQTFLVGERALGMGGAFTGYADDPSASYYNPAGIAQIETSAVSGSLSVNAFNSYVVEDGYGSPVGTADLEHDGTPTVPLFVGLVKKFGPRHPDRVRRHAVALSTVHPQSVRRSYQVTLFDPATTVHSSIHLSREETNRWYGPSYAFRVTPELAIGLSAFLATREIRHEEDEVIVTTGARDPADGFYRNATLSVRESLVEVDATGIVLRAGVLWDATERLRLGLMFQPPAISLDSGARVFERRSFADLLATDPVATFFHSDQSGLGSTFRIPMEIRIGASYQVMESLIAALDVSVYMPVGSEDDPISLVGPAAPEPITGDTPQPGVLMVTDYHSELAFNVSAGVDTLIAEVVPFRVGVFTDLSAAPSIDGPSDRYAPARVNGYGATLSVGVQSGGYDLAIGAAGLLGTGRGLALNPAPGFDPVPETFVPTDVRSRSVYFFLSGAKRAASRLARDVYDEYLQPELQAE